VITDMKVRQGTAAWFEMAGTLMLEAASQAGLSSNLSVSFVERYIDGDELSNGLVQGLRFDIIDGRSSFRVGVRPDERADITVEITAAAARELNRLYSAARTIMPRAARFSALAKCGLRAILPDWGPGWTQCTTRSSTVQSNPQDAGSPA
jgi:hypothetical protein